MDYKNLQKQLDEIKEEGCGNIGYNLNIFKDESFDLHYTMMEIIPELIKSGILNSSDAQKYTPDILLDEYLSDLDVEEFYYLAPYFFNYKRHNKEDN